MERTATAATETSTPEFLSGGGELGRRIREYDWSKTSLGPIHTWPHSLRSVVSICLNSNFPIAIYWDKEKVLLYNDSWSPIPGNKHPWALGRPAKEVWPDIWNDIEPQFAKAYNGEPGGSKDALLPMRRHGYTEECYFDFTFTPIYGEAGKVEGVFNAVIETTYRVTNERRTAFLKNLALHLAPLQSSIGVLKETITFIKLHHEDISFAEAYILQSGTTTLVATTISEKDDVQKQAWPFEKVLASGEPFYIPDVTAYLSQVPKGYWPEEIVEAIVLPLKESNGVPVGFSVCGLSARRRLDAEYRVFFESFSNAVTTVLHTIGSLEAQQKKLDALAEVDRAKTVFFSNISHEFRTPLTLMLAPVEDALHDPKTIPANRERLDVAYRNILRLQKLVNNLLDFSRIGAGRMQTHFETVDVAALTKDLASSFRSAIEKAGLRFEVDCDEVKEPVAVDVDMWEKIVLNLISNAFKYTNKGAIRVSLKNVGDAVQLSVSDTGVGIAKEDRTKIFERFHRVQNTQGRTQEGTGIGLSLVRELVKLHDGTIEVESEVGKGSTFIVSMPVRHEDGAQTVVQTPLQKTQAYVAEALKWAADERSEEPETTPSLNGEQPRVLLADDNADMRAYIQRLLAPHYRVQTATNGEEAYMMACRQPPDLIISDVMMPQLDGFGLLKKLRETATTQNIPFLFLSARAGEEAKVEGYDVGADDYLVKPFSVKELLARVRSQLNIAKRRDKALQELYHLFDAVPFAVAVLKGESLVIEFINQYNLNIWQAKKEEVLGKPLFEARPDLRASAEPVLMEIYRTHKRFTATELPIELITNGKKELRYFNAVIDPMFNEKGDVIGQLATSLDITEQVLARKKIEENEAALRESESQFRTIADKLPQMVWMMDANGRVQYASKQWQEYSGIEDTEEAWATIVHPGDRAIVMEAWNKNLTVGQSFRYEVRLRNSAGQYRWHYSVAEPIKDETGTVLKWIGALSDIHDQKTLSEKLEKLVAERTRELQRSNDDLQQFAHVASHDLKEPVRKVRTFANRLSVEFEKLLPEQAKLYLSKIESASLRMYSMIDGVLLYSSLGAGEQTAEHVDLNDVLRQVESDLEVVITQKGAALQYRRLPVINGSPVLLYQLFYNLVNNSLKFAKAGVAPRIKIEADAASVADVKRSGLDEAKSFCKITVRDNGIGFRPSDAEKIFKTFTRLNSKDQYEGTGLGLALCKKIVERHGGAIAAEGVWGEGAVFSVLLPETKA